MTWHLEVSDHFARDYRKACGKNKKFRDEVNAKVDQIRADPLRFKPLRKPLQGLRRVHVMSSYVIVYEPVAKRRVVRLLRLAHHDEAYGY